MAHSASGTDLYYCAPSYKFLYIGLPILISILFAIVGNVMVILSVILYRKVRSVRNTIIASMAFADLCIAVIIMPFSAINLICNKWLVHPNFCMYHVALDFTLSQASIYHIGLIAVEQYYSVQYIFYHRDHQKKKRIIMFSAIVFLWILSGAMSYFFMYLAEKWTRSSIPNPGESCLYFLNLTREFVLIDFVLGFAFPMFIIVFVYYRVFKIANHHAKSLKIQKKAAKLSCMNIKNTRKSNSSSDQEQPAKECLLLPLKQRDLSSSSNAPFALNNDNHYSCRRASIKSEKSKVKHFFSEHKAMKTLGIIISGFILCWLPYFLTFLISPYCLCVPLPIFLFTLWLAYFNSAINPVIYAIFNKKFRHSFKMLLKCNFESDALMPSE